MVPAADKDTETGEFRGLIDGLLPVLASVGAAEIAGQAAGLELMHKADGTPVTTADREAEVVLLAALARLAPGIPVVAEEAQAAGLAPEPGATFFLLDPLDGTRDFIAGRDTFTINIGLVRGGRPVFGLIYAPAKARLFATIEPGVAAGTTLAPAMSVAGSTAHRLHWLRLATRKPAASGLEALTSRSTQDNSAARAFLATHSIPSGSQTIVGSALKFGLIAAGEADVYPRFGPTCEWDTAAGEAIVTAAGGVVEGPGGRPLVYGRVAHGFINPPFVAWGRRPVGS